MRFQAAALKKCPADTDQQAVENGILAIRRVLMGRPVRDGEPEPSGEGGQSERQHEAIVETIGEEEEEACGRQEIEIPLPGEQMEAVLQVSEFYAPDEAAEVKHVVEDRIRCRRFGGAPSG